MFNMCVCVCILWGFESYALRAPTPDFLVCMSLYVSVWLSLFISFCLSGKYLNPVKHPTKKESLVLYIMIPYVCFI